MKSLADGLPPEIVRQIDPAWHQCHSVRSSGQADTDRDSCTCRTRREELSSLPSVLIIEQQPKNNQERKKREAGIDELHRISPTPSISCENNGKKKARADAHPCTVR